MALRFPYVKRRVNDDQSTADPNLSVDPADESIRRGLGTVDQYPVIDPNLPIEPTVQELGVTATPVVQPAIDPALLTRVRTAAPPTSLANSEVPSVDPASEPIVNTTMGRVDVSDPAPLMVRKDKSGRPLRTNMIGDGDSEARNRAYGEAVDEYVPKAEPKWKRYLRIAAGVGSMFAGAAARDPETVARAANAVGTNLSDSKYIDKAWKRQQQAEVGKQVAEDLAQKKTEAQIADMGMVPMVIDGKTVMVPRKQAGALAIRQKGVDARGQRVSDQKMSEGLLRFNQLKNYDPTSPRDAGLKKIFEENYGLHDLPAKNDDKFDIKMVNGEYEWIPKKPGEVTTIKKDGQALVDPSHIADQSVTLPNGTVLSNLTPKEKAAWEGRVYESAEDRKSRERIASQSQAGQDRRQALRGAAINSSVKGAFAAISKYRGMSKAISRDYGTNDDPSGESNPAAKTAIEQRDAYATDMKKMYGQYIELDSNGKPLGLRDDAVQAAPQGLTIEGAVERFKIKHKRVPTAKETANMQAAIDAIQ